MTIQKKTISPGYAAFMAMQQAGHMKGSDVVWGTDNICPVKNQAGVETIAKGVMSSSAGNLEVHLVNDFNAAGDAVWNVVALVAGDPPVGKIFDYMRSTNTTVTLADVEIIL